MIKGEISQRRWVTLFHTLTGTPRSARVITSSANGGETCDALTAPHNGNWTGLGDATWSDKVAGATHARRAITPTKPDYLHTTYLSGTFASSFWKPAISCFLFATSTLSPFGREPVNIEVNALMSTFLGIIFRVQEAAATLQ
jgi:hypothetical protein